MRDPSPYNSNDALLRHLSVTKPVKPGSGKEGYENDVPATCAYENCAQALYSGENYARHSYHTPFYIEIDETSSELELISSLNTISAKSPNASMVELALAFGKAEYSTLVVAWFVK